MALEEITQVDLCQVWFAVHDQIELLLHYMLTVLESHLREPVHHFYHVARLDIISSLQIVE